jgi:glutamate-1-semialdehyde 2,1-aminomutase
MMFETSRAAMARAAGTLAGGVNSFGRVGMTPTPLVFTHADGAYLFDADGNRLLDYYLGMGPMMLGHTPAPVTEAVAAQLAKGILYAGQTEIEFEAARLVCQMVPCAERVRFASSGTEAVQAALRLARAVTGRNIVLKFEGHYHGWTDSVLWSTKPALQEAGRREAPTPIAGSRGQDPSLAGSIAVLPWNDLALLRQRLSRQDIAAVIMEPVMCNAGAIVPLPGYLEGVQAACRDTGTLLIFDETITGFRVAPGGAQQLLGVTPDLATFGKAIASGFPVAAVAGRADLMDNFAAGRGVLHGGTYNGAPPCMAATVATLNALSSHGFYEAVDAHGEELMAGLRAIFRDAGVDAVVGGFGTVFYVGFGLDKPATEWRDLVRLDQPRYVAFCHAMLKRGVRLMERSTWFLSSEHKAAQVEETLRAAHAAIRDL